MPAVCPTAQTLRSRRPRIAATVKQCRLCLRQIRPITNRSSPLPTFRSRPFFESTRHQTTQVPTHVTNAFEGAFKGSADHQINSSRAKARTSGFPKVSDRVVAYWLLGSAASVFGIVVFGGLTRLTESGLSITEWRPVTGSLPPLNSADWDSEFAKYRASPEFKLLNPRMSLEEFKQIYFMEWTHRLWGRVIGLTFLVPTAYFIARRRVSSHMAWKLTAICGGIGLQGVIGWWMVKSGLKDDLFAPGSHPRVSQYRLTAHLGTAFAVYLSMVWCGLEIFKERALTSDPTKGTALLASLQNPKLRVFKRSVFGLAAFIFATALTGALVAGLDAGMIYNEFPYMGLGLTPPKSELWDPWYSRDPNHKDLWWRNMLENPSLVQLDHRIMATTAFTAIMMLWSYPRLARRVGSALPQQAMKGLNAVFYLAWVQVTLGISTLIYMVPTWLAASHQAGALALLTGATVLANRMRISPRLARMVREAAQGQSARGRSSGLKMGTGKAAGSTEQQLA